MRSYGERLAFAKECELIEQQGGDVLEYIRVHWPSYTPGATWFNLQRTVLDRKNFTSGKPKTEQKERSEEIMKRDRMKMLDGLLDAIRKEIHPYDYLEEQGYMVPVQALTDLKAWAKKNAPDKYEQLPTTLRGFAIKRKSVPISFQEEPAPELKPNQSLPVKLPEKTGDHVSAEKYRETIRMEQKKPEGSHTVKIVDEISAWNPEKPSPTCCQPARPSGVTVPDELPVCAVKSQVAGKWELARHAGFVHLVYQETQCLTLHKDNWLKLAEEIPVMLKQLGLD